MADVCRLNVLKRSDGQENTIASARWVLLKQCQDSPVVKLTLRQQWSPGQLPDVMEEVKGFWEAAPQEEPSGGRSVGRRDR